LTSMTGAPAAASAAIVGSSWSDYKQVQFLGPAGHIEELYVSMTEPWRGADLTGLAGAPPAVGDFVAIADPPISKEIVYHTSDRHIHVLSFPGDQWTDRDLTALVGGEPPAGDRICVYSWDGVTQIAYATASGHIHALTTGENDMLAALH